MPSEDHRAELRLLGKAIGTATGWDALAEADVMFYNVERNALGKQFMPAFIDGFDLSIHFENGEVTRYDPRAPESSDGDPVNLVVDWSVFNEDNALRHLGNLKFDS